MGLAERLFERTKSEPRTIEVIDREIEQAEEELEEAREKERIAREKWVRSMGDDDMLRELRKLCTAYAANDTVQISLQEPTATSIGEELNRRGGLEEMRRIHSALGAVPGARTLEMHWDGIGDWRG